MAARRHAVACAFLIGLPLGDGPAPRVALPAVCQPQSVPTPVSEPAAVHAQLHPVDERTGVGISQERDRDTLDALLTTPMTAESILSAKLLGCLTSMRLAWLWYGAMGHHRI